MITLQVKIIQMHMNSMNFLKIHLVWVPHGVQTKKQAELHLVLVTAIYLDYQHNTFISVSMQNY